MSISESCCATVVEEDQRNCIHHWIIEEPKGPTSRGVCKLCGVEREFENFIVCNGEFCEYEF